VPKAERGTYHSRTVIIFDERTGALLSEQEELTRPAARNRIHLIVKDLDAEIDRLARTGLSFRSDMVTGPGGRQILLTDPASNLIELFQPADQSAAATS
jgi:predicted enzyme related to lactoylglutathione lyase